MIYLSLGFGKVLSSRVFIALNASVGILPSVVHLLYNVELLCGLYDVETCDNMVVVVCGLMANYFVELNTNVCYYGCRCGLPSWRES